MDTEIVCPVCADHGVWTGYILDGQGVRREHFNKLCPAGCAAGLRSQARLDNGEPVRDEKPEQHGPNIDLHAKIAELRASTPDWPERCARASAYSRGQDIAYARRARQYESRLPMEPPGVQFYIPEPPTAPAAPRIPKRLPVRPAVTPVSAQKPTIRGAIDVGSTPANP